MLRPARRSRAWLRARNSAFCRSSTAARSCLIVTAWPVTRHPRAGDGGGGARRGRAWVGGAGGCTRQGPAAPASSVTKKPRSFPSVASSDGRARGVGGAGSVVWTRPRRTSASRVCAATGDRTAWTVAGASSTCATSFGEEDRAWTIFAALDCWRHGGGNARTSGQDSRSAAVLARASRGSSRAVRRRTSPRSTRLGRARSRGPSPLRPTAGRRCGPARRARAAVSRRRRSSVASSLLQAPRGRRLGDRGGRRGAAVGGGLRRRRGVPRGYSEGRIGRRRGNRRASRGDAAGRRARPETRGGFEITRGLRHRGRNATATAPRRRARRARRRDPNLPSSPAREPTPRSVGLSKFAIA